jgi:hypothetical protein
MQISAANLLAAQQAAQAALAAKQAARAAQAAPAFALPDFNAAQPAAAEPARAAAPAAATMQSQPGAKLGQHINIVV